MPRVFWRLFLSMWLSIMTFAVVVSWINETLIMRDAVDEPTVAFELNLNRFKAKLARELKQGGERQVTDTLKDLPRGIRKHVFLLDPNGRELLGRKEVPRKQIHGRIKVTSKKLEDANGNVYTLISSDRVPPRAILAPGPRGVGMRLAVAAVISALVSLLLARYLAAPLGQLSRASRLLATGDLAVRVGAPLDHRKDEFGQLAVDLDEMASRLELLQQANQRLLRDVSHELRSPLARLRVALEIARNKDQSRVTEELNRIELESERLEQLVDEVLGLLRESSGPQELKRSQFDLAELLQDLVDSVNYETGDEGRAIELQLQPALQVNADRELLWRVFENLLRNALIHTGSSDDIHVSAERVATYEIQIRVCDRGPGIEEHHIGRIFEPFYRADEHRDRNSGGHGLGLAIAASAVRRHGGRISASNRPDGGLEVLVVLPTGQQHDSGT